MINFHNQQYFGSYRVSAIYRDNHEIIIGYSIFFLYRIILINIEILPSTTWLLRDSFTWRCDWHNFTGELQRLVYIWPLTCDGCWLFDTGLHVFYPKWYMYIDITLSFIPRRHYLETDPDPIAMVIRVELFTHKPSETNTNWHCMVTHAHLLQVSPVCRACGWIARL